MNTKIYIFILTFLCIGVLPSFSQVLYNNGAPIVFNNAVIVQVNGSLENANSGNLSNDGQLYITGNLTNNALLGGNGNIYLSGDWINNNNFNPGLSHTYLNGANQNIAGTVSSNFNILDLTGTGIKSLQINTSVSTLLALNDRELSTGNYIMNVLTPTVNAITRTTGFVSSTGNGNLNRATASSAAYLFPVGSSTGTLRYRPVEISPVNASVNTYSVRFVNNLATSDGYDISLTDTNTCMLNPDFYHRINRTSGTAAAGLAVFYDEIADGLWDGLAHWMTTPSNLWQDAGNITQTSGTPLNNNFVANWNNFTNDPYILSYINPVVDLGPDTFVCDNSSIIIDAGANWDTYLWSTGLATQTINVSAAGTYYVTVTNLSCSATDSIKVLLRPSPTADAGENTSICSGEYTTLTGNGGTSYAWSDGANTQSTSVNPVTTTTYYLTVTENYCSDTDSVIVTVVPTPVANAGPDQTICINDSIQLTATGGSAYEWSSGETTQTIVVKPLVTTNYIVTVTDSGCEDTDTVLVSVVTSVTANAGPDQNICEGDDADLSAGGGTNYIWNTGAVTSSINVSPLTTTTYFVTVSVGSCSDVDSVTVNVFPYPVADAGANQSVCDGESATLTASGGGSYYWSNGANTQSTIVYPTVTTTYYLTVTDNGCSSTDFTTVTVYPLSTVYAGPDQVICTGDTVTLTASSGVQYLWSTGESTQSISVSPSSTTTYVVTITDVNGCTGNDGAVISVVAVPNAFAGQDVEICQGDTIQLNASGGTSYQWYPNTGLSNPNIYNPYSNPQLTIIYYLTVSNGSCDDMDTLIITVYSLPAVYAGNDTTIYLGDQANLHATNNSNYSYLWSPNTYLDNPFVSNPVSSAVADITYTVQVNDSNNCKNVDMIIVRVIEKPAGDIVIYNTFTPNIDGFNDFWIIENIEQYPGNHIEIYNRNGHKVFEADDYENNWDGKYFGSDLPAATYYFLIDLGDDSEIIKGDLTIIR